MIGTNESAIEITTNATNIPIHGSGAAQKMRQLSPHHAAPSPARRSRGGGAGPSASDPGEIVVVGGICIGFPEMGARGRGLACHARGRDCKRTLPRNDERAWEARPPLPFDVL